MSKAAQLLRTHTTFSLGFHLCCQLQSGPQATFSKHPPNFRMWMSKLWFCRTLHPPWRTIHVHEIYMMILAPLPKNGHPCSETWHSPTEDMPWVLSPKFITQWSPICKVEYEVRIPMGWYDLTCTSSCLIKKVHVLLVTFCPQKQAMDLVHRKCFGGRKWVRTMNRWLVPFNSLATFQCT